MWGRLLIGAALALVPSAALACQCDDPAGLSTAEKEERARFYAGLDLLFAEVERLDDNRDFRAPQRYRIHKRLWGEPPSDEILIYPLPTRLPNGEVVPSIQTSCDYSGTPGFRKVMAFRRGPLGPNGEPCGVLAKANHSGLSPYGQCLQYLLDDPAFVRRILELKKAQPAGVSRSNLPPSSSR
jgi:hypothetical protein